MAMCEELGLATGVQNQDDDTKDWHTCVDFWLSLGWSSRNAKLKGERDYGEQTLATPKFQRSHVRRGVVNMILMMVKSAMCEKYVVWRKTEKELKD